MRRLFNKLLVKPAKRLAGRPICQRTITSLVQSLLSNPKRLSLCFYLFKKFPSAYLIIARVLREQAKDHDAFLWLMKGQRCTKDHHLIHIKLSELYRDNGDVFAAHTHLKIADKLNNPGYSAIRLLAFASDHGLLQEGSDAMARVLELPPDQTRHHLPMLNRVSIYYPQHQKQLHHRREELKRSLKSAATANSRELSEVIKIALSNRWLAEAIEISKHRTAELTPHTLQWLNRVIKDLSPFQILLDQAWNNEDLDRLAGIRQGQVILLKDIDFQPDRIVEVFIPTPFFARPDKEKPTYETIRKVFIHVFHFLLEQKDLVIVPRMQLNWKYCFPKVKGARVVSYHTCSFEGSQHIHVQESPLAGCCSLDRLGFAGFSSLATDYEQISRFTAEISDEILEKNQRDMYHRYVIANVSKYKQPSENEIITGSYVFIALQIPTDIVSHLAWISGVDLLQAVVDFYKGSDTRVIVKRHPYCGSMKVQKRLTELEAKGDIICTNSSIHSLIASAQLVFTVNSGVGLEALIHGKSVIVSGACDYSYAATSVKNVTELFQALSRAPSPNNRKICEFLYFYTQRFAISSDNVNQINKLLEQWLS
jgi:hypothetical protein